MAVFGTLGVVGVTLALFASGKVRASKRATQIFLVAIVGYARVLARQPRPHVDRRRRTRCSACATPRSTSVISFPLGVPLGILVVLLAAYSLVLDFDGIKRGVTNGAPRKYAWTAAFGLMVTIVWLYLEILRLIALIMGRRYDGLDPLNRIVQLWDQVSPPSREKYWSHFGRRGRWSSTRSARRRRRRRST